MLYDSYFRNVPTLTEDALSKELKRYQLSLVAFGRFQAQKARSISNMALPYHRIIYITGSAVRYQVHETAMILEKGDVLYTPPNTIYNAESIEKDQLPEFIYLYFEVLPCHQEQNFIHMMETSLKIRVFHALESPVEFYFYTIAEEYENQRPGYYHKIHSYLLLLVMELLRRKDFQRKEAPSHDWESGGSLILNKAASYIAANIREPLRVSQVSHACGVSESFLYKLFSSNLNISPKEYILNCKMEYAVRLLRKNMTVTQIARELGFSNPNHFSNAFYKIMGKRPSEFKVNE